ncbi:hypothetical protein EDF59_12771 [Novosphingobium sp. ST904]|nr:hypothetical protein EDF59_12771 [Novosphingobium sp. ST904]
MKFVIGSVIICWLILDQLLAPCIVKVVRRLRS